MKKIKLKQSIYVFGLVVLALVSACGNSNPMNSPSAETQEATQEPVSSIEIPAPEEGFAVVYGRIIESETGEAPNNAIFLARNITADNADLPAYFSFSYTSSPRGAMDENGFFVFKNVPEDQYAILLFEPGGNHHLIENGKIDDERDYLWVNAVANETLDMGTIVVP